jgi:hypothetical protein
MAQLISPLYDRGFYDHKPRQGAKGRLDPKGLYEITLCNMPRGATLGLDVDCPHTQSYVKASFALNARLTQSSKHPALAWAFVRIARTETRNAHMLITRLT